MPMRSRISIVGWTLRYSTERPSIGSEILLKWLAKPLVFALALIPFGLLAYGAVDGDLGANPLETVIRTTGEWTLRFLMITLAVTPLRAVTGWSRLLRFRRMLGLFAFFYASVHLSSWVWLDQELVWANIVAGIAERPYVTVGFTAWLLMLPLALTSTRAMMRRLGSRWKRLHRLVYAAAILGVLHFIWLVKADLLEPLVYAGILAVLLLARWWPRARRDRVPQARVADPSRSGG